ncbi:MAG: methyltransferase domain-containing protein [bacterium]|nr:methyltransferase domain-containing protein [bacterium]
MNNRRNFPPKTARPTYDCVLETVEGLEALAHDELLAFLPRLQDAQVTVSPSMVAFPYNSDLRRLANLKIAQAVYLAERYAVPRPKALLGDQHWRRFMAQIETVRLLHDDSVFKSFTLSAAGTESSVMQRIRQEIAAETHLPEHDKGDLWIRILPAAGGGWQTLVRLFSRPLATRNWRVCSFEGALNATVAAAMNMLAGIEPHQAYLNLGSGSGTLMIERAAAQAETIIGVDHDAGVMQCAAQNITASGNHSLVQIMADLRTLPFSSAQFDALTADLPFGQKVGSHADNKTLYPAVLLEAARVARTMSRFVAITHEVRLMESLLADSPHWQLEQTIRITLRGLHPRIYVLRRTNHII